MTNSHFTLNPGDIFEKYRIERRLGQGGMGEVYLAEHQLLETWVAVKTLSRERAAENKRYVERFIREAKLATRLKSPHIVSVYDAGYASEHQLYFIIMEYVGGGNLREKLHTVGRFNERDAIEVMKQLALALQEAESFKMVHRDIKPENVMFDMQNKVKLADMGIAKSFAEKDHLLTLESSVFGTPAYMSPEQARDSRKVDIRSDIYSLGVMFFEMLCGQRPFLGHNSIEILSQVLDISRTPDFKLLSGVSDSTIELIRSMTLKKAETRLASASVLYEQLCAASVQITDLETLPTLSASQNKSQKVASIHSNTRTVPLFSTHGRTIAFNHPRRFKRRLLTAIIIGLLLLLLSAGFFFYGSWRNSYLTGRTSPSRDIRTQGNSLPDSAPLTSRLYPEREDERILTPMVWIGPVEDFSTNGIQKLKTKFAQKEILQIESINLSLVSYEIQEKFNRVVKVVFLSPLQNALSRKISYSNFENYIREITDLSRTYGIRLILINELKAIPKHQQRDVNHYLKILENISVQQSLPLWNESNFDRELNLFSAEP